MREAWLLIYIDPQSYEEDVRLLYSEPQDYDMDPDYKIVHIVYTEIE